MSEILSSNQWKEDLHFLETSMERDHCDPWHSTSQTFFRSACRRLRERIPNLASHEIVTEFARIMSLIEDGHTVLRLTEVPDFQRFPVSFYTFSDGIFIRSVAPQYSHISGAKLLGIDDTPINEVFDLLRPLISRDNEMGVWNQVADLLSIPEVLHARGVATSRMSATFHLELLHGEQTTLKLDAIPRFPNVMIDAAHESERHIPLWLRFQHENGFDYLPDERLLYLGYNVVRDGDEETLAAFFARVFDVARTCRVERFVLDLRRNGGGNKALNEPLIQQLIRDESINQPGTLFVIIGRGTFSAAMNLAVDLERHTHSLFAGEPTGTSPNHFGENTRITLPNSMLKATVSALWWQNSEPYDDRAWIAPDIPVRLRSIDYVQRRDPVLEAIRNHQMGRAQHDNPLDRLMRKLRRDDLIPADVRGDANSPGRQQGHPLVTGTE